jgi:hypothetical protein
MLLRPGDEGAAGKPGHYHPHGAAIAAKASGMIQQAKQQFGFQKVHCRGPAKNDAQLNPPVALPTCG